MEEDNEFFDRIGDGPEMTDDFYSEETSGNKTGPGGNFKARNYNSEESAQRRRNNYFRNQRYNDAYGNYRGGYGPGQGYGPMQGYVPGQGYGPYGPHGPPGRPMGEPDDFGPPPPPSFGPPGGGEFWGRGYNLPGGLRGGRGGAAGPPKRTDNRALGFMRRCGVGKEHLKNLPRDLLNLIEPEYCGLCGHSFETYAISRMHYISKNHLKKMKKWVTNKDPSYQRSTKEIPMKSRDLYCELCDVHITSKVHAESHYSGKPHRAIVEGRKMPKNPFLLQSNMKERLDQLVRREKKHLKVSEDVEPEGADEDNGEAKSTMNPDLYCEICKTSVTCSEQMTMHLNGKRHLSREKQHILKMMKGPGKDKSDAKADITIVIDDEEEEEDGDDEGDEEMAGNGNVESGPTATDAGAGETDDWVNGSGDNWDETH